MKIKSLDQLRKHVSELNAPLGLLRLFSIPVFLYILVTAFFNLEDRTRNKGIGSVGDQDFVTLSFKTR